MPFFASSICRLPILLRRPKLKAGFETKKRADPASKYRDILKCSGLILKTRCHHNPIHNTFEHQTKELTG
jgi:hypothetical protein